nr:MAG TPA: hypothetical protein [Bacteriophage sp.]
MYHFLGERREYKKCSQKLTLICLDACEKSSTFVASNIEIMNMN